MPRKRSPGDGALYYVPSRKMWRAVVDNGTFPDGRRRQKAIMGKTQSAVREKLRAFIAEPDTGAIDPKTTLAAWSQTWLETVCKPKLKPNALAAYESVTRRWIVPTIGRRRVRDLKPHDVRSVHQAIMKAGRSSSTARKAHDVLSGMLDAARADGIAARNVAADVDAPRMAISNRGSLAPEEAIAILGAASDLPDGTRWWVALLSGLRQSERLGARIDSLDLDNGVLAVEWALDEIPSEHGCGELINGRRPCGNKRGASCPASRLKIPDGFDYKQLSGRLCLIRPKSGRVRYVPLIPQLVDALRRYLVATENVPNPHGLIWRNLDGTPILPRDDEQSWRDLLQLAGVITAEQNRPGSNIPTGHWARHTTATVLMELGVDAKIIGEIVGHQSERVTRGYQHVTTAAARDAMDRLGAHFAGALTSRNAKTD